MATWKQFVKRWSTTTLAPIARPVYNELIRAELAWERRLDKRHLLAGGFDQQSLNQKLTAIIKTFERPEALLRLVTSIRRFYPHLPVIVADDSREPKSLATVQTIALPFNSGASLGRNVALEAVQTPYFLLLDDDFVFYRHTGLVAALGRMEDHPEIDILGGEVVNLPLYTTDDYSRSTLLSTTPTSTWPSGSRIGDLPVYDKVANFFIGRTDRVRLVQWDPNLWNLAHNDFFTRARGVITTVYDNGLKCLHAPTPFNANYARYRNDFVMDQALLLYKYNSTSPVRKEER